MKNLDLNALGVKEMNEVEMKETNGGIAPIILWGGAVVVSSVIISGRLRGWW